MTSQTYVQINVGSKWEADRRQRTLVVRTANTACRWKLIINVTEPANVTGSRDEIRGEYVQDSVCVDWTAWPAAAAGTGKPSEAARCLGSACFPAAAEPGAGASAIAPSRASCWSSVRKRGGVAKNVQYYYSVVLIQILYCIALLLLQAHITEVRIKCHCDKKCTTHKHTKCNKKTWNLFKTT